MAIYGPGSSVVKQLVNDGVMPQQCVYFRLDINTQDVVRITTEVVATKEQVQKIADALRDNPEEAKAIARSIAFRSIEDGNVTELVDI